MLIFQSILVYGFIIWVMTYFGNIAYKTQYPQGFGGVDKFRNQKMPFVSLLARNYYVIPIFVFCFFSAIRYKVGVDCDAYRRFFYEILNFGHILDEDAVEQGFMIIAKFTTLFVDSHYLLFFILAFLQISFIYYAFRNKTYVLVYMGMAIMLNGTYFSLMNGVRQNIVACAFVAMIPLVLAKKKWPLFILSVLVATLMHKSALILLPTGLIVYFLFRRGILNIPIQLAILMFCIIFMDKIDVSFLESFFMLGEEAGYSVKKAEAYANLELTNKAFGPQVIISLISYIIVILYSNKLFEFLKKDTVFIVIYNLFFVGVCIDLLFYNNFGVGRLNMYLVIFQPVVLSILLFYLSKIKGILNENVFYFLITILFLKRILILFMVSSMPNEFILYKFDIFRYGIEF